MVRRGLLAFPTLLLLLAVGCGGGDADGRYPVSGNVTFRGASLANGAISFESANGSQRCGASIADGKYSLPVSQGLLPGSYTVRVSSVESATAAPAGPPGPEAAGIEKTNKDLIPPEFGSQSKLTYECGPGKPASFDVTIP